MAPLTAKNCFPLLNGSRIPACGVGVYLLPASQTAGIVEKALDVGYRLIDTAQEYENERETGEGIKAWLGKDKNNKREDVLYTTKITNLNQGYDRTWRSLKESLNKVKHLEYIDLVLIHDPLSDKKTRIETWKALQEAVDSGMVKSIGVSNFGKHHIQELYDWEGLKYKPIVNQIELSPWLMRKDLVDYCQNLGIVLEAYCPLTTGAKLNDPTLVKLAKKYNKTPAQVLLRWNIDRGVVVIPKSLKPERLPQNFDLFDFKLTDEDFAELAHPDAYDVFGGWDPSRSKS